MMGLPDVREVLAFEATCQHEPSWFKPRYIRARWHVSSARYHHVLGQILDDPRALLIDPPLVARLIRVRDQRRSCRHAQRLAS